MAAAGKFKAYDFAKKYMWDGTLDLDSNALKMAIFLSTSNCDTLSVGTGVYGDLTNEHANANGYTTGGVSLSGLSVTRSAGTTTWTVSNLAPGWTASGGNIVGRSFVIYVNATVNTIVKPLISTCLMDATPADVTCTDGNPLNVTFNASGILTLSGATSN